VIYRGKLYVGTDVGVFTSRNGGRTWLRVGRGLPLVPITDIVVQRKTRTLAAASFGRGMWALKLPKR
jgi:ligand-binding sensor domain-containing protein